LELLFLFSLIIVSYAAIFVISIGAETPAGGMSLYNIAFLLLGFFLLSIIISVVGVLTGIGGGVIYTPLMLAFTPVDSLIVRATGILIALFGGLVASGPFMKTGIANLKLSIICTIAYGLGGFAGAQGAIYVAKNMGATGEGIIRMALGLIVLVIVVYFLTSGKKSELPEVKKVGPVAAWLNMTQPYFEQSTSNVINYKITRVRIGMIVLVGVGVLSGFFGMGAGWSIVPGLNMIMGVPLKVAAASSNLIIGLGDSITVWPYIHIGAIIPLFVAPWIVGKVIGGIIGAHILIRAKIGAVRFILIGILSYTSFGLLSNAIIKLGLIPEIPGIVYIMVLALVTIITVLAILDKLPKIQKHKKI